MANYTEATSQKLCKQLPAIWASVGPEQNR